MPAIGLKLSPIASFHQQRARLSDAVVHRRAPVRCDLAADKSWANRYSGVSNGPITSALAVPYPMRYPIAVSSVECSKMVDLQIRTGFQVFLLFSLTPCPAKSLAF